jgi:deoxyribodipyrimidine photo-lyase
LEYSIQEERIKLLNDKKIKKGRYVLYWMQASQRILDNHALAFAIDKANSLNLPLVVFFGIKPNYPEANQRHYFFMLQGLQEVQIKLEEFGINVIFHKISPEYGAVNLADDASLLVVDRGYINIQRLWRDYVANRVSCPCIQIESDVIVPLEIASNKEEFSAATLRPKISSLLKKFLIPLKPIQSIKNQRKIDIETLALKDLSKIMNSLNVDKSVKPSIYFKGGTTEALKLLQQFILHHIFFYKQDKNDPVKNCVSNLSPYLHFGQISPLTIALKLKQLQNPGVEAYLEELIMRRELSMNFVFYNKFYDSYKSIPEWCKTTLSDHRNDTREYTYSIDEFENAETHDQYWNAAQKQMVYRGKMHGYMRMYWGKKIIEWTQSPEEAYKIALCLNNKYELDGRDPNGFAGIAWCFGKHDRPWKERPIFGKIRYMNANGLKRKFDIDLYAKKYDK